VKQRSCLLYGSFFSGILLVLATRIYQRRSRNRIPSLESLDDPDVAEAFGQVSTKLPWRLLRWYIAQRALRLKDRGEIVDLGCGPGYLVRDLAKHTKGLHITGVDSSNEMLNQAKAVAQISGIKDRVSFKIGNAARMPFEDHSLDLIVSTLSLHHWKNPIIVMNEIARVLKPSGVYLIFDLRRDMAPLIYIFLWFITHIIVPPPLRNANEPMSSRDAAYTPGEAAALVEKSKLENAEIVKHPAWMFIIGKMSMKVRGS
jgi:ubiquinone/menaquinone biosynthesis C-methylase UbiE